MKKIPFLFLSVVLLCSCSKEPLFELTGTWKLTHIVGVSDEAWGNEILYASDYIRYEYTSYDILYKFNESNALTVLGETNQIDLYFGHDAGKYMFSLMIVDERIAHIIIDDDVFYTSNFSKDKIRPDINNLIMSDKQNRYIYSFTRIH